MKKVIYSDQLTSRRRHTCRPAGSLQSRQNQKIVKGGMKNDSERVFRMGWV